MKRKMKLVVGMICVIVMVTTVSGNFSAKPTRLIESVTINTGDAEKGAVAVDINPTDDAQVSEGYPTSNYGAETYLYVQSAESGASDWEDERAWLKFDLSGSIPDGETINSATLRLYCWKAQGQNMDASVHGSTDDTWLESSINWNNQPSFELELDAITLIVGQTYVWREWNVTSFVQNQWAGDKIVTFVIKPTVEDSTTTKTYSFNSKEYTGNYPVLRIDHTGAGGNEAWVEVSTSPYTYDYGVGVEGAREYIFFATSTTSGSSYKLMKYNTVTDEWTTYTNVPYQFKNCVAMVWDGNNYIYTLFGGSYTDCKETDKHRYYFQRFNIDSELWEPLSDTPWYQGPGDAITWIKNGNNEYIYAVLGTSSSSGNPNGWQHYPEGVQFWRYNISSNSWEQELIKISYGSDDGADLVWTGGEYLYAFPGAYDESLPKDEERHFFRYNISEDNWVEMEMTPYNADGGVDDGGSLLYPGYGDYIYALKGGDDPPGGSQPGDDFWRYSISNGEWEILPNIPEGVGEDNGNRLGLAGNQIYCWRAYNGDGTLWSYQLPFVIEGYGFYDDIGGEPVNALNICIRNVDADNQWQADTSDNYYNLELNPGIDINASETLRIVAHDGTDNYAIAITHTITQEEFETGTIHLDVVLKPTQLGDCNVDGVVNGFDIDPFVVMLVNQQTWQKEYCNLNPLLFGDCNQDGYVNAFDIDSFVAILVEG